MTTFDLPDELRKLHWENQVWMTLMVVSSIVWARCWFVVEICILRSSASKMCAMLRGIIEIRSFMATRNRVTLIGEPWEWRCTEDSWPVILTEGA